MRASTHLDAGHRQTFVERVFELVVDLLAVRAERQLIVRNTIVIIGIATGNLAQRGVALHAHEVLEDVHARRGETPVCPAVVGASISKTAL